MEVAAAEGGAAEAVAAEGGASMGVLARTSLINYFGRLHRLLLLPPVGGGLLPP